MDLTERQKNKQWTQSLSSQKVWQLDLKPEQVRFHDIPHALAQKVRFQGQSWFPLYSVAQHCIEGARLLPWAFKLPFLLHEISDVYLPDVPGPMKPFVFVRVGDQELSWSALEATHATAILEALGLSSILPLLSSPEVKRMDWAMLAAERDQKMGQPPDDWDLPEPPAPVTIRPMSPEVAAEEWTALFHQLTGRSAC